MTTIGKVEFRVDFDGKALPAQAKAIGERMGRTMGSSARKAFDSEMSALGKSLNAEMKKNGDLAGISVTNAIKNVITRRRGELVDSIAEIFSDKKIFTDFIRATGDVDEGLGRVQEALRKAKEEGALTNREFSSLSMTARNWGESARKMAGDTDKVTESIKKLNANLDKSKKKTEDHDSAWKKLSFNLRQALVIIAAIAAGGESIAVLGSAAGAGLVILGAAALSAGAGLGVLIAGLRGVTGDIAKLPEAVRPAAQAIQELGKGFTLVQDAIQVALLDNAAPTIKLLTDVLLPALGAGLVGIATALNGSLTDLIGRLTSEGGILKLEAVLSTIAGQVPLIVSAIGSLGGALAGVFIAAGPATTTFLTWLAKATASFDAFAGSVAGQTAIREWFDNGVKVLSAFGDLLGGVGKTLANLVDADAVKRTVNFLDHLTGSLPFLEKIIDVLGHLDAFGLVANILDTIGNALVPVLDLISPIADILNASATRMTSIIAIIVQFIGIALTPLKFWLDVVSLVFTKFYAATQPLVDVFVSFLPQIQAVADAAAAELMPAIEELIDAFLELLPSPAETARILEEDVIPAIKQFAEDLTKKVIPAAIAITKEVTKFIDSLGGFEGIAEKVGGVLKAFEVFGAGVKIFLAPALTAVNLLIKALEKLGILQKQVAPGSVGTGSVTIPGIPGNAAGALITRPTFGLTGEAGPEAIVPLNRPLSQVDNSVRALSAIAQGKAVPGDVSNSRSLTIGEGAIVVYEAGNGATTAGAIFDRFVAEAGG